MISPCRMALSTISLVNTFLVYIGIILVYGCATQFEGFEKNVRIGYTLEQVETYLTQSETSYIFHTCDEWMKSQDNFDPVLCKSKNSHGMFKGISNDGSYILGAGSSDVLFEIEIGQDLNVNDIRLEDEYTFL